MAKAKRVSDTTKTKARRPTLKGLRSKIDAIDKQLVKLANDRAKIACDIGKIKDAAGQPIYAPSREVEVLAKVVGLNLGPLSDDCLQAIFRELISGSRALERELRIAFLGPAYTYSHLAALRRFGHSVEMVPVGTIGAVFEEVNRGQADFGLVPLENSTDGRIADTLDMFTRLPLRLCGEVQLWIHHHLLGKCSRSDVKEVYSRPQALSQCRNWLAKHLPQARTIEVTSTATAAQLANDKPGAAAIASQEAGVHYGLDLLAAKIEDNRANLTRFAVIGESSADRTGKDKTAMMFEVEHRAGALADAMMIFKRNRLNLTWIESFPIPDRRGSYLFFVEMDGHEADARVKRAVESIQRKALRFEVLGSFPAAAPAS